MRYERDKALSNRIYLLVVLLYTSRWLSLNLKRTIFFLTVIIISLPYSTAGHKPLRLHSTRFDPWLLASSICKPTCANHHCKWPVIVLNWVAFDANNFHWQWSQILETNYLNLVHKTNDCLIYSNITIITKTTIIFSFK